MYGENHYNLFRKLDHKLYEQTRLKISRNLSHEIGQDLYQVVYSGLFGMVRNHFWRQVHDDIYKGRINGTIS